MKHLFYMTAAALTLSLSACGNKDAVVLPADTVGLRITSEVAAGITADRITVIPNDVAPWVSQILLLSNGELYRTTADGGKAQGVNGGDLKDMIGLMRKGDAGTVLTLTRDGKLTAMIEKDDEGRLSRMNVSSNAKSYDGFCQNDKAPSSEVIAFSDKSLVTLKIDYQGDDVMTITTGEEKSFSKPVSTCLVSGGRMHVISGGQLYIDGAEMGNVPGETRALAGITATSASALIYVEGTDTMSTLRAARPDTRRKVIIQDGLSVLGTEKISTVFTTSDSLGGTFSEGALIAQDASNGRLVLVSLPFAQNVLSKQTVAP